MKHQTEKNKKKSLLSNTSLLLCCALTFQGAYAADFTYRRIADWNDGFTNIAGVALNDTGDIAFIGSTVDGWALYLADANGIRKIVGPNENGVAWVGVSFFAEQGMALNNNGEIVFTGGAAATGQWTTFYYDGATIQDLNPINPAFSPFTQGSINQEGRTVLWGDQFVNQTSSSWQYRLYTYLNGIAEPPVFSWPGVTPLFGINDNNVIQLVWQSQIIKLAPGSNNQGFLLNGADWGNIQQHNSLGVGFNNNDAVSFVSSIPDSTVDANALQRVAYVDDNGVFTVADNRDAFLRFSPPALLTDNNQVVVRADLNDGTGSVLDTGLYILTSPQVAPIQAVPYTFMDGADTFGDPRLRAHSVNNAGQVAFVASSSGRWVLFLAEANEGVLPSRPIIPNPDEYLPADQGGGWELPVCRLASGRPCFPRIGFYDPVVATGYDFNTSIGTPNFATVLVPVRAGFADTDFTLEVEGQSIPLQSGTPFDLTSVNPAGVSAFRITGIDPVEALDPNDPSAFVIGLGFVDTTTSDNSFTMVPVTFRTDNQAPVADAGLDQSVRVGELVNLVGSATDPDGDPVTAYAWSFESMPIGSAALISNPAASVTDFVPDVAGQYVISLTASDGQDVGLPAWVTVDAATNLPPVPSLRADTTAGTAPLTIQLDASASSDPEGFQLQYEWDLGGGAYMPGNATNRVTFDVAGSYVVSVRVTDDMGASETASLLFQVTNAGNTMPRAVPTATPTSGDAPLPVQFFANASDTDGDALSYDWDFADPASTANHSTEMNPQHIFTAPGIYNVTLSVSDGMDIVRETLAINVTEPALSAMEISTKKAVIKFEEHEYDCEQEERCRSSSGRSKLYWEADFIADTPAEAALISVAVDGDQVVSEPLSSFKVEAHDGEKYLFKRKGLVLELDYEDQRLKLTAKKLHLASLQPGNGVDFVLSIDNEAVLETLDMYNWEGEKLVFKRKSD